MFLITSLVKRKETNKERKKEKKNKCTFRSLVIGPTGSSRCEMLKGTCLSMK